MAREDRGRDGKAALTSGIRLSKPGPPLRDDLMVFRASHFALLSALVCVPWPIGAQTHQQHDLAFSVQVVAASTGAGAEAFVQRWTTANTPLYTVPVMVNETVYYRVLAGFVPTEPQAVVLMDRLVAQGVKESAAPWDVKATGNAFHLGSFGTATASDDAVAKAVAVGIPAYSVLSTDSEGIRYKVFAGGFDGPEEAKYLKGLLEAAGLVGSLIPRRGVRPEEAAHVVALYAAVGEGPSGSTQAEKPKLAMNAPTSVGETAVPSPSSETSAAPRPAVQLTSAKAAPTAAAPVTPTAVTPITVTPITVPPPASPAASSPKFEPSQAPPGQLEGLQVGFAAMAGVSSGTDASHLFGGIQVHPQIGRLGFLVAGMYGTGSGYESMVGYGAVSFHVVEVGGAGISVLGGYGFYQEQDARNVTRDLTLPTGGAMVTYGVGDMELIGTFTGMFGSYLEEDVTLDLSVIRMTLGLGLRMGGVR